MSVHWWNTVPVSGYLYIICLMCACLYVCSVPLRHAVRFLTVWPALSWQQAHAKPCHGGWQALSKYVAPWIILPLPGGLMLTWNVLAPWLREHGLSNLKCGAQRKFAKRLRRLSNLSYGERLARTQTRKFGNWVMLICLNVIYDCTNIDKSQFNVAFSASILLACASRKERKRRVFI